MNLDANPPCGDFMENPKDLYKGINNKRVGQIYKLEATVNDVETCLIRLTSSDKSVVPLLLGSGV